MSSAPSPLPGAASPTPSARPPHAPGPKVLRACVVQEGRVLDEQRLGPKEPLTIGQGSRNTFVVSDASLPRSHKLFDVHGGGYELVLTEGMRGKVSAASNPTPVDFANLKTQGLLKKKGDYYILPLRPDHRGKVVIGNVTIIFQFVTPPPPPAVPKLPALARGEIWRTLDWPYAIAFFTVLVLELPLIVYFEHAPQPAAVSIDTIDDRWADLIVPDRKPEVKKPEAPKNKDAAAESAEKRNEAAKREREAIEEEDPAAAKARAQRQADIKKQIVGKGILGILGTMGDGSASGAVADVFGSGFAGGDLDAAFDGISGVGLATDGTRSTRGGGSGEAASIGGLATSGGGKVGLGGKQERRVAAVKTEAMEVDGALDPEAIQRVVRSRQRMVQDCYERELKRDPSLAGKVEVEITIGPNGRVEDVVIATNTVSSKTVAACIVTRIRGWHFPKPDGGSVTVNLPFIFTSSG